MTMEGILPHMKSPKYWFKIFEGCLEEKDQHLEWSKGIMAMLEMDMSQRVPCFSSVVNICIQ